MGRGSKQVDLRFLWRRFRTRTAIKERLTKLWNYEKYTSPFKEGGRYFYKNDGLQNQNVLYTVTALDAQPRVLLDPNKLSPTARWPCPARRSARTASTWLTGSRRRLRLARVEGARRRDGQGPLRPDQVGEVLRRVVDHGRQGLLLQPLRRAEGRRGEGRQLLPEALLPPARHAAVQDLLVYERKDQKEWGFDGRDRRTALPGHQRLAGHRSARTASSTRTSQSKAIAVVGADQRLRRRLQLHRQRRPGLLVPHRPEAPRGRVIAIDTRQAERGTGRDRPRRRRRRCKA